MIQHAMQRFTKDWAHQKMGDARLTLPIVAREKGVEVDATSPAACCSAK